jgi:exodeoxyribonuclease-3
MRLQITTLNIANPSAARAAQQLEWLSERSDHILVLTETGPGAGTRLLLSRLTAAGWQVRATMPDSDERGTAIATRIAASPREGDIVDYLPARAELLTVQGLDVVGLYVPSRDESELKTERKRRFCTSVSHLLAARTARDAIAIGDLNVLEPIHRPHYNVFRDWEYRFYDEFVVRGFVDAYRLKHPANTEYSWVDYEGRGYRFDHAFVSTSAADAVRHCDYDHSPREQGLSDHSALIIELDRPHALEEIEVATITTSDQSSLF